jgi:hypothetical protein
MGRHLGLVGILILFTAISSFPPHRICTPAEAQAAQRRTQLPAKAGSWANVYDSFKRFGHCDDGSIAEGYSDANGEDFPRLVTAYPGVQS